jgi:hypothetical protein
MNAIVSALTPIRCACRPTDHRNKTKSQSASKITIARTKTHSIFDARKINDTIYMAE